MRKIKYRAKVKLPERPIVRKYEVPEGQWVYGEPHTIDCPTPHIHTANGDVGKQPIDKETICQFTGMCDGAGTEIYEGDFIFCDKYNSFPYKVYWDACFCCYRAIAKNRNEIVLSKEYLYIGFRVIGNIYDNPELMNGGVDLQKVLDITNSFSLLKAAFDGLKKELDNAYSVPMRKILIKAVDKRWIGLLKILMPICNLIRKIRKGGAK